MSTSLLLASLLIAYPGQTPQTPTPAAAPAQTTAAGVDDTGWVRTKHEITIAGKHLNYTTTVGLMPIRSDQGDVEGRMFFTAYHVDDGTPANKRPITFAFNGGPGSASIYLHSGVLGPKRVKLQEDGSMPPPPYEMVPNDESVIPETDLVMIDPIGCGWSRPEKPELAKKFYSPKGDVESVGQFIQRFLIDENRLLSPIFVLGESYGGIRGSGLAGWMTDKGLGLNGLILVSPLINSDTLWSEQTLPLYLPTYATTAWYHHKLSADKEAMSVEQVFRAAQKFVYDDLMPSTMRGSALDPAKRKKLAGEIASWCGLTAQQVEDCNLLIQPQNFFKMLLKDRHYTVGRFDSRLLGIDRTWVDNQPDYDPSDTEMNAPIISTVMNYLREELGYKTTAAFWQEAVNGIWEWEPFTNERGEALRGAMHKNPYMKLMVTMGLFDLACPTTTVEQALNILSLDPRLASNITRTYYPAGHMSYIDHACRIKFHADIAKFISEASHPSVPSDVKLIGRPKGD